jgi:hypothetical protein
MLHPKQNRIDYGEQLIPPDGYELAYAIGSTYSLDLEALLVLPVALFYSQNLSGSADELRYDMLDAITKSADKITVYYQSGQLKVPKKYHPLMAFWENGVQPITMSHHASSFHPKVWVIRYESKEEPPKYRVLVSSRNLTFARDWDVAFSTDGTKTIKEQPNNKPLIDFVKYLNDNGNKKMPLSFINDLMYVNFDIPEKFDSLKFKPIGISNTATAKTYINPITDSKNKWDEMLIISPFVDKVTLNKIQSLTVKQPYLLSRKEELNSIDIETLNKFKCYQFSTFFQEAEYYQENEDGGLPPLPQNLHAKLFITLNSNQSNWFLGSANCSDPAQERNVEFMVELKSKNSSGIKPKDIFKLLTDPSKSDGISLFTEYNYNNRISTEEQKQIALAIREIKYNLSKLEIKGEANLIPGGSAYNLIIEIDAISLSISNDYQVNIKPLPESQKSGIALQVGKKNIIKDFGGYSETTLSVFLVFEISKEGTVYSQFLLPMEIDLPESRFNRIFTSIIDSREKFLKYLTFLLTGEETNLINGISGPKKKTTRNETNEWAFSGTPVYEKLLIAASRFPDKLKSINALILRLKEESDETNEPIITPEFECFWNVFQTFITNKS